MDICLHAAIQGAVEAVEADDTADPPVEAVEARDAFAICEVFMKPTGDQVADIRVYAPSYNSLVYSAWAWSAGEPLEDAKAADESEYDSGLGWNDFFADSANMMTSTLAAIATIAMVAY